MKTNVALNYSLEKSTAFVILYMFFSIWSKNITAQSRLYLANDDHTDYMWTANETTYDSAFIKMIDAWMANNTATSTNSPDYQTKFSCDGTYWAWAYEKNKTPAEFQNFINQVKSEKMVIPINPLVITYGCVPAEAAIRGMYYAGELKRKYNISFDLALSMENQVMPLGLASLWKGCGAKYSWKGICNCTTQVPGLNSSREREMYWYKGLDGNGVLMKWYNYTSTNESLGGYAETRDPVNAINELSNKVNTPGYNYNIAAAFGVGWDDLETLTDKLAPAAQAASNSSKRVIVSNEVDFFKDFESTYGATLPSLTQTYGNEWEDACASLSEVSAKVKRSLEQLRSAEAMATIVSRTSPDFENSLNSLRREAWMS
ncbi:MAG: glycoside hydrolase, partial [Bacteroidota bacterium]|nr:glycoside hydrolase [Bacteroidota bacterium]